MTRRQSTLYVIFSRADKQLADALLREIAPLQSGAGFRLVNSEQVSPGLNYEAERQRAMVESDAVVLLLSPDFLHDEACSALAQQALMRSATKALPILPLLLRSCSWETLDLQNMPPLTVGGKSIAAGLNEDHAWPIFIAELQGWLEAHISGVDEYLRAHLEIEAHYRRQLGTDFSQREYLVEPTVQILLPQAANRELDAQLTASFQPSFCPPEKVVQSAQVSFFLGSSAAGKTTLLYALGQWAARSGIICSRCGVPDEDWRTRARAVLPVFVALEELPPRRGMQAQVGFDLLEFAADHAAVQLAIPARDLLCLFHRVRAAGRLLLLVDNLGVSVDLQTVRALERQISTLVTKRGEGNRAVIAGPLELQRVTELGATTKRAQLQSLSAAQIATFVGNALQAGKRRNHLIGAYRAEQEQALLRALHSNGPLRTLVEQPQLLAMWIEVHKNRIGNAQPASDRLDLLERYVEHRLLNYSASLPLPAKKQRLARPHAERLLGLLGRHFLDAGSPPFLPLHQCQLALIAIWNGEQRDDRKKDSRAAEVAMHLEALPKHSGLLTVSPDGRLSFTHNTLRDFFAARAIAGLQPDDFWNLLSHEVRSPQWQGAIAMSFGLRSRGLHGSQEVERLLQRLIDEAETQGEVATTVLATVLGGAVERARSDEASFRHLVRWLQRLSSSRIPAVRLQVITGLSQLACMGQNQALVTFREWLSVQSPAHDVIHAAKDLVTSNPHGLVARRLRELLDHADPTIEAAAIVALRHAVAADARLRMRLYRELDSLDDEVQRAAFGVLMPLFSRDKTTRQELKQRLHADNPRAVGAAFRDLDDEQLADPELRVLFDQRLLDQSPSVRLQLLIQLISRALHDVGDRDILLRTLHDPNMMLSSVLMGALFYLSRVDGVILRAVLERIQGDWPPLPTDLPVQLTAIFVSMVRLMDVAEPSVWEVLRPKFSHPESIVREWMARALAGWLPQIPELKTILWKIVEADQEDGEARRAALEALQPIVPDYPEWLPVLERRLHADTWTANRWMLAIPAVLGDLARQDPETEQVLQTLLQETQDHIERIHLINGLLICRPEDGELSSELITRLTDDNHWVALIAWNFLAPRLTLLDLQHPEVCACFAHVDVFVRRAAVKWLCSFSTEQVEVRNLLLERLSDRDLAVFFPACLRLLATSSQDAELFAQCAISLRLFRTAQGVSSFQGVADYLALVLSIHAQPAAALALVKQREPMLAAQLEKGLLTVHSWGSDPVIRLQHLASRLERESSSPDQNFLGGLLVASAAKLHGQPASDIPHPDLDSPSPRLQMNAIGATLGQEAQGVERILGDKAADPSASLAMRVIGSAIQYGKTKGRPEAIAQLKISLTDREPAVRLAALIGLLDAAYTDAAVANVLTPWIGLVTEGMMDLRSVILGTDTLPWMGSDLRKNVAEAVAPHLSTQPQMYQQIVDMLDSPRWQARQGAAWALSLMPGGPPPEIRVRIRALLYDRRSEHNLLEQLQAAQACLKLKDIPLSLVSEIQNRATAAIHYGLEPWMLAPQQSSAVRASGVRLVAALPNVEVAHSLLESVADEDPSDDIRNLAHRSLTEMRVLQTVFER